MSNSLFEPTGEDHRRDVIEDVEWLTDCNESPDHIAHRLGYANPANLAHVLDRWGRHGLARRLRRGGQVAA